MRAPGNEFSDCFDDLIDMRITSTLRRDCPLLNRGDQIAKIAERIDQFLKSNKMAALRKFDSRRGSLQSWVSRLAEQATLVHLDALGCPPGEDEVSGDDLDLA